MTNSNKKNISQISKTNSTPSSKKAVEIDALAKDIDNQLASAKKDSILKKPRSFLGAGAQSVAIENGHKKILLATPLNAAQSIELVKKTFFKLSTQERENLPFEIPTLVGKNMPLRDLMNLPHKESLQKAKETYLANLNPKVINGKENVIYELTRYDGTLEDFRAHKKVRFKYDSIDQIQQTISQALDIFHQENLAHGDIACRNIFYTGTYPNFKFYLGDFGSAKVPSNKKIHLAFEEDKHGLNTIIKKLQAKLNECPPSPVKAKTLLMQYNNTNSSTSTTSNSSTESSYGLRPKRFPKYYD